MDLSLTVLPFIDRGSSSSDRDLSSTSSISEDDSLQEQPSPNLLSSRLKCKQYSTSSDNVFQECADGCCLYNHKHDVMPYPHPSSTMPSNGIQPHKENCLILECRKFEASLRALLTDIVPSKSYQPNSKKFHSAESLLFSSKNENFDSAKSNRVSSAGSTVGRKSSLEKQTFDDSGTGSWEVAGIVRNKPKNSENLLNFKPNICVKSGANDVCGSSFLTNISLIDRKNDDAALGFESIDKNSINRNQTSSSTQSLFCQKQTDQHQQSFFQTLKDDFLSFFMNSTEEEKPSSKKVIKFGSKHHKFNETISPVMSSDLENFAVREFPLSSCPQFFPLSSCPEFKDEFIITQVSQVKQPRFSQLNNEDININSAGNDNFFSQISGSEITSKLGRMDGNEICKKPPNNQKSSLTSHSSMPISTGVTYGPKYSAHDWTIDSDPSDIKSVEYVDYNVHANLSSSIVNVNGHHERADVTNTKMDKLIPDTTLQSKNHELDRQMVVEKKDHVSKNYQNRKVTVVPVYGKLFSNGKHSIRKKDNQSSSDLQLLDIRSNGNSLCLDGSSKDMHSNSVPAGSEGVNGWAENDMLDKKGNVQELSRYYHVFREGELVDLILAQVPSLKVISCTYDHANWCVVAEKN